MQLTLLRGRGSQLRYVRAFACDSGHRAAGSLGDLPVRQRSVSDERQLVIGPTRSRWLSSSSVDVFEHLTCVLHGVGSAT